jgi:hypothetical protein
MSLSQPDLVLGVSRYVVDHDGVFPGPLSVIGNVRGAALADSGRREACFAGRHECGFLIQVVANEVLIDIAQHRIAARNGVKLSPAPGTWKPA